MKHLSKLITACLLISFAFQTNAEAAFKSMDELYQMASFYKGDVIVGYKDVEKKEWRDIEKTGFNEVEVPIYEWKKSEENGNMSLASDWTYQEYSDHYYIYPKNNYAEGRDILKSENLLYPATREEVWTELKEFNEKVPYKVKEPIYKTIYKTNQTTQAYYKASTKYKYTAKDKTLKTVNLKFPKSAAVEKIDTNWYKGKITYTNYKKVTLYRTRYQQSTNLTYYNKSGKKTRVAIDKNAAVSSKNGRYYTVVTYTPYKKVTGKWVKQKSIKQTLSVSSKNVYKKQTINKVTESKSAYVPAKYVSSSKIKTGEKTVTKYKTVTEYKQVPAITSYIAWDQKVQTGTKIEKEPYTYTEKEIVTFTAQEPIYETQDIEKTIEQKYTWIFSNYIYYGMNENELFELLNRTGVSYQIVKGYDLNHDYGDYTPTELTDLLIFEDGSAVNLSLFLHGSGLIPHQFGNVGYFHVRVPKDRYILPKE